MANAYDRNEADSQGLHTQELLFPGLHHHSAHCIPASWSCHCLFVFPEAFAAGYWRKNSCYLFIHKNSTDLRKTKPSFFWPVHQIFWTVDEGQLSEHCAELWHSCTSSFSSLDFIACMTQQNSETSKMFRKCWRQILQTWVEHLKRCLLLNSLQISAGKPITETKIALKGI